MCGNHTSTSDHHHSHLIVPGPVGFRQPRRLHRRAFLGYFGKSTAALAILGPVAAACASSGSSVSSGATTITSAAAESSTQPPTTSSSDLDEPTTADSSELPAGQWSRANLGNVSAYVLARGSELAIVDTGLPGSADAIGTTITDLGFTYDDVKHVVLTHFHGDHAGSIGAVLAAAPNAVGYTGELDLDRIDADLRPLVDGDAVLGMQVLHTPGHTPGHIALFDELTSTLVAGDAMNGRDGGVTGANPNFTPDMATAGESIKKMAQLQFDDVYFGHGEPVIGGASSAVMDLAAQL